MKTLTKNYSVDPNNTDLPLQGSPSTAYGLIRAMSFQERKKQGKSRFRIFFGEAGRKSVPWGCLWYEIDGVIYQFGSGISRYPEAVGPDGKGISEMGIQMLAAGLRGDLTTDDGDFKWVQEELDLTPLLTPENIQKIKAAIEAVINGQTVLFYQSRTRAKALGLPINPGAFNCTSFIGNQLGECLGLSLTENMPFELFKRLSAFVQESGSCPDALDTELAQVLSLTEQAVMEIIQKLLEPQLDLKELTKFSAPLPDSLSWQNLMDSVVK